MMANIYMFVSFLVSRSYSKVLNKLLLLLSGRSKEIREMDGYLIYPPKLQFFEKRLEYIFGLKVKSSRSLVKATIRRRSYFELITLHKYYNTILDINTSVLIFHEILRRNSRPLALLRPYGLRRYLATHIMLGGMGIKTFINTYFDTHLVSWLLVICSFGKSVEFNNRVFNKSISVVGGAPSPRENQFDIDQSDLVVRINRDVKSEERMDIVYFRSEKLNYMYRSGRLGFIANMGCLASLKTFRHYFILKYLQFVNKVAPTPSLDSAFDCGKLNAIPTICLDLLSKSASKLFIFDTDLNLSKKHKEGYRDPDQPVVEFDLIFGEHPGYIQFVVLKYMDSLGRLEFESNDNFDIKWSYRRFLLALNESYSLGG